MVVEGFGFSLPGNFRGQFQKVPGVISPVAFWASAEKASEQFGIDGLSTNHRRGQIGPEYASTGRREVHPAALIFTACTVRTHMRKTGAAACPVEGERRHAVDRQCRSRSDEPLPRSGFFLKVAMGTCMHFVSADVHTTPRFGW